MIYTKHYPSPSLDHREILRYAGCRETTPEVETLLNECLREAREFSACKVCWGEFPVYFYENQVDLGFATITSSSLANHLASCDKIILFAATIGLTPDRLITRYSSLSPSKALFFQAMGAQQIEALCNLFNDEIRKQYALTCPRFSPGYGDLPLSLQQDIFRVLDCPRKIGLSLNDSLLMTPTKSVTAIIGIKKVGPRPALPTIDLPQVDIGR